VVAGNHVLGVIVAVPVATVLPESLLSDAGRLSG